MRRIPDLVSRLFPFFAFFFSDFSTLEPEPPLLTHFPSARKHDEPASVRIVIRTSGEKRHLFLNTFFQSPHLPALGIPGGPVYYSIYSHIA
jgi:hypothetical protein